MRKITLLSIIFMLPFILKAQLNSFDLSTYKLPDIKRHYLNFNAGLGAGNSKYNNYQQSMGIDDFRKYNNIAGDLGIAYGFYRNSETYQGNQYYRISLSSSFNDQKNEDGFIAEEFRFSDNFGISSINRFYLNNRLFLEADGTLNQYYTKGNYSQEVSKSELLAKYITVQLDLGLGLGRIEEVQDAWLAIYILQDLHENGRLKRIPTDKEILEFSSLISQLKNERFFDARLQKIKEIEAVDKFLQDKDLIEKADARYFALMNDNWDNAANQIRKSGKRISFLITPYVSSKYNFSENEDFSGVYYTSEVRNTIYQVQAKVLYSYEKPINLFWQNSFNVALSGNYTKGILDDIDDNIQIEVNSPQLNASVAYSVAYYPNSRTYLRTGANMSYFNYFGSEEDNNLKYDINYFSLKPGFDVELNYYISPQILFTAAYDIFYYYTESNSNYYDYIDYNDFIKTNSYNQSLNIGFTYKIF